jgi:hypothetical protein
LDFKDFGFRATLTCKAITRPVLENGSSIWNPIISDLMMTKTQSIQNSVFRIVAANVENTNQQHMHNQTEVMPLKHHTRMLAGQDRVKVTNPGHRSHHLIQEKIPPR